MASLTSRRNSSFPCAQCNHVYPFEFSLTNHIKKEHNSNFECYNCGSIAKTAIGLMQHMKLHVKKDNVKEEKNPPEKISNIIEQKENAVLDNIKEEKNVPRKVSTVAEQNEKQATKAPVKKTKSFTQQIGWDQNEPTIPKGWKISTNYEFKLYLSPTGRFFKSRELAYASMIEEGTHSAEDLHLMKTGEKSDWIESPTIPEGWKINIGDGVGKEERFKSPDGVFIFQNRKDAYNYMLQKGGYSSKDLDLMSQKNANTKKQSDWLEDDTTVPSGWKVKNTEVKLKNGVSKKQMFKINKKVFDSRQAAFAYMVACRTYSSEDLELMKTGVKTKWEDGDESMPKGWKIRTSNNGKIFWFKSPDGKILYSRESAYNYMTKKGGFSEKDVNLMKSGLHNVPQLTKNDASSKNEMEKGDMKPKIVWSNGDGKLPNGWKMRITDKKRTIYLSPDRNTLSTLMQCLQFMIKRKYANKDIQLMAKNLLKEGWEVSKNIPKGWYMKKDREGTSFNFLTDEFKLILGVTDALNFMTNSDKFNNIDMEKLLILVKLVSSSSSAQSVKKESQFANISSPSIPMASIPDADFHTIGNKKVDYEKKVTPSKPESFSDSITEEPIPLIPEIPSLQPSASLQEKHSVKSDLDINSTTDKFEINLITAAIFDKTDKNSDQSRPQSRDADNDCQSKAEFVKTDETDNSSSQPSSVSGEVDTYDSQSQARSDKTNDSEYDLTNDSNSKPTVASAERDNCNSKISPTSDKTGKSNPQTEEESPSAIQFNNSDNSNTRAISISDETDKYDSQSEAFDKSDEHNTKTAIHPHETAIHPHETDNRDVHTLAISDQTNEHNSQTAAESHLHLEPTEIYETDKHYLQPEKILDEADKHQNEPTEMKDETDKHHLPTKEISDETDEHLLPTKDISDETDKPLLPTKEILDETDKQHLQPTEILDETDKHQNEPNEISNKTDKHTILPTKMLNESDNSNYGFHKTSIQGDELNSSDAVASDGNAFNSTAKSGDHYESDKIDKSSPKQNIVYNETDSANGINEAPVKDKIPTEDTIIETEEFKIKRSPKRKAETDENEKSDSKRRAVYDETNPLFTSNKEVSAHVAFSQPTSEAMEVTEGFNAKLNYPLSKSFWYEFLTDEHETNFINIINEFKESLANDNEE